MYLYHDSGHKQWRFTNDLGGKKELFFATEEKSAAKCPADVGTEVRSKQNFSDHLKDL